MEFIDFVTGLPWWLRILGYLLGIALGFGCSVENERCTPPSWGMKLLGWIVFILGFFLIFAGGMELR